MHARVLLTGLSLAFLLVAAIMLSTQFHEGSPGDLLWGVVRLELTSARLVQLPDGRLLQRAGSEEPLTTYLEESGWRFEDRLGSMIVYGRNDTQLMVDSRMLTRRYTVYRPMHPMLVDMLRGLSPRGPRAQILNLALALLALTASAILLLAGRRERR